MYIVSCITTLYSKIKIFNKLENVELLLPKRTSLYRLSIGFTKKTAIVQFKKNAINVKYNIYLSFLNKNNVKKNNKNNVKKKIITIGNSVNILCNLFRIACGIISRIKLINHLRPRHHWFIWF